MAQVFHLILLTPGFVTPRGVGSPLRIRPATPCGLRLPPWHPHGLGYSPFARRYSGNRIRFLLLGLLKGFTSPGSAPAKRRDTGLWASGFPHSGIPGSLPACGSPGLIAACHALHPFWLPRHPPWTLSSLAYSYFLTRLTFLPLFYCHVATSRLFVAQTELYIIFRFCLMSSL